MTTAELNSLSLAAQSVGEFDQYLPTRIAAVNADTGKPFRPGIITAKYFEGLGTRGKRYWIAHGRRITAIMSLAIAERMTDGETQEVATLAVWALLDKPPVVCALLADGSVRATSTEFPASLPLTSWAIEVADVTALTALTTQGDAAVLAALAAAQIA